MKNILLAFLFTLAYMAGYSQLFNSGGSITVQSGATLIIEGDYTSSGAGNIDIDGTVELKGNFVNNSGTIDNTSGGTLKFVGGAAQEIKGTSPTTFECNVEVNNGGFGVSLASQNTLMNKNLVLTSGKLTLGAYNLTMGGSSVITANATNYVVTNGAGLLKRPVANSDVAFPVGVASTYNPLVLNNAGTADTYGVKFTGAMPSGWTGTDHAVTGHWTVSEDAAGNSDLTVTAQWVDGQEQTNFDNTDCAVGLQVSGDDVTWASSGPATGPSPWTRSGSGFTGTGNFLVGDNFYLFINLDLDLFLAGPYSGGVMSTALKTANLIPLTDPYGGTVTVATIPANVVDWVLVEFRNKSNNTQVLYSRPYFLDNNGNVLNTDGAVGAKVQGVPKDQYFIAVRHRNHLGVMTQNTIDLATPNPAFNFAAGSNVHGTFPMRNMGSGVYALWGGDANGDGQVIYQGANNDPTPIGNYVSGFSSSFTFPVNNVYSLFDINMDGSVIYQGSFNDPTPIGNMVSAHPNNTGNSYSFPIIQQLP